MAVMEHAKKKEHKTKKSIGIGLIIIHAHTGQILAIREQMDDPRTARKRGELSIPLETRKEGESPYENLCGAMAEVVDDKDQYGHDLGPYLRSCFFRTNEEFIYPGFSTKINGRSIYCNIAVLIYDGPDIPFKPYSGETTDVQWVSPLDFAQDGVRSLAQLTLTEVLWREEIYRRNLATYRDSPHLRTPVFKDNFSIRETCVRREQLIDMK